MITQTMLIVDTLQKVNHYWTGREFGIQSTGLTNRSYRRSVAFERTPSDPLEDGDSRDYEPEKSSRSIPRLHRTLAR